VTRYYLPKSDEAKAAVAEWLAKGDAEHAKAWEFVKAHGADGYHHDPTFLGRICGLVYTKSEPPAYVRKSRRDDDPACYVGRKATKAGKEFDRAMREAARFPSQHELGRLIGMETYTAGQWAVPGIRPVERNGERVWLITTADRFDLDPERFEEVSNIEARGLIAATETQEAAP
jgi:hypothetical protein